MLGPRTIAFLATEIVAGAATVVTASQRGATVSEQLGIAVAVTGLLAFLYGVYKWLQGPFKERQERRVWSTLAGADGDGEKFDLLLFKALERNPEKADQLLFKGIERNPERFTRVVFRAIDADDDSRSVNRRIIDRLYVHELAVIAMAEQQISANKDAIIGLEESNKRQGEALTKDLANAVREFTRSNDAVAQQNRDQTTVMKEIQREIAELREKELKPLREAYVRLDERFNAQYDGPERRKHPR